MPENHRYRCCLISLWWGPSDREKQEGGEDKDLHGERPREDRQVFEFQTHYTKIMIR